METLIRIDSQVYQASVWQATQNWRVADIREGRGFVGVMCENRTIPLPNNPEVFLVATRHAPS